MFGGSVQLKWDRELSASHEDDLASIRKLAADLHPTDPALQTIAIAATTSSRKSMLFPGRSDLRRVGTDTGDVYTRKLWGALPGRGGFMN